jgi:hypothetical protein
LSGNHGLNHGYGWHGDADRRRLLLLEREFAKTFPRLI